MHIATIQLAAIHVSVMLAIQGLFAQVCILFILLSLYIFDFLVQKALTHVFKDINECNLGTYSCAETEECNNTVGSYECICKSGYSGNPCSGTQ